MRTSVVERVSKPDLPVVKGVIVRDRHGIDPRRPYCGEGRSGRAEKELLGLGRPALGHRGFEVDECQVSTGEHGSYPAESGLWIVEQGQRALAEMDIAPESQRDVARR
jgi:hypothetical protein